MANQPRLKNIVNARELARMLGVTNATIRDWEASGLPILKKGSPGVPSEYDSVACVRWWAENISGKTQTPVDLADAEKREAIARAELRELELMVKKGQFVMADDVERTYTRAFANIKTKLQAMPTKLAPRLVGFANPAEIQDVIAKEVRGVLTSLADGVVTDDADSNGHTEPVGGDVPAGGRAQPKRVGRRAPAAK
jgi:phage terminase Nu1 subunit (DNA packaging protein)